MMGSSASSWCISAWRTPGVTPSRGYRSTKVLFAGDACVNGAWNFVGDGNVGQWIRTLDEPHKLAPSVLCPGHGSLGDATLLDDQQQFFRRLTEEVERRITAKTDAKIRAAVEDIRRALQAERRIARYASGARYEPPP